MSYKRWWRQFAVAAVYDRRKRFVERLAFIVRRKRLIQEPAVRDHRRSRRRIDPRHDGGILTRFIRNPADRDRRSSLGRVDYRHDGGIRNRPVLVRRKRLIRRPAVGVDLRRLIERSAVIDRRYRGPDRARAGSKLAAVAPVRLINGGHARLDNFRRSGVPVHEVGQEITHAPTISR
jgi:hypothetical protein